MKNKKQSTRLKRAKAGTSAIAKNTKLGKVAKKYGTALDRRMKKSGL